MPSVVSRELIEARAYEIWEREGRPEGREFEHWATAAAELSARKPKKKAAASNGQAAPSVTGAAAPAKARRTARAK